MITLWCGENKPTTQTPWTVADNRLPSPVGVDVTYEQIWNEDAGRNAKGTMVAKYIASKYTYAIKWGMIDYTTFVKIRTMLKTGTFYFAWNSNATSPPTSASKFYRSEIAYTLVQAGGSTYYNDVTVSVIQW